VVGVADHLTVSRPRWRASQTSGASVLGHTYGLTKTSVPSLQLGSGSRGSTGTSNTTAWWWRNNSSRVSPKPWLVTVEQREERPRGGREWANLEDELYPPIYRREEHPKGWGAPAPWWQPPSLPLHVSGHSTHPLKKSFHEWTLHSRNSKGFSLMIK